MSKRFGILFLLRSFHQADEAVKQVSDVSRAGRGFRVALEAERRRIGALETLQRTVEQRHVGHAAVGRQGVRVHGKAVVLGRDQHLFAVQVLHRVVGAVVAELHFQGGRARRQAQDLVAEANAEQRHFFCHQLARGGNRVIARLRVTRTVGQEHAVRVQRQHVGGRRLRRHHGDLAAARGEHAQDVALDAVVERHHVEFLVGGGQLAVALAQRPFGVDEFVRGLHRHDLRQVHAVQARERTGQVQRLRRRRLIALRAHQDGAGLRALFAQDAGQLAGIDTGDGDDVLGLQVVGQRLGGAEIRCQQRQVADDQTGGVDFGGLDVFGIDAVVADVRIRQGDDLAAVGWIGKDLLVTGHGSIENHFPGGVTGSADRKTFEDGSVSEGQDGWNGGARKKWRQGQLLIKLP
uniref:Uncharacterized protein n=1 Tax=Tanacetum cinerariifolium TaxID=118510 RepID=A0A699GI53_TANCI|nr:hypothetical protein [Tanacetum cinerariifolium]